MLTNQRPVSRSRDLYWPIRGEYYWPAWWHRSRCTWRASAALSGWKYQPIRDQYPRHMTCIDQSEASIHVTWHVLTNERPVLPRQAGLHHAIRPLVHLGMLNVNHEELLLHKNVCFCYYRVAVSSNSCLDRFLNHVWNLVHDELSFLKEKKFCYSLL